MLLEFRTSQFYLQLVTCDGPLPSSNIDLNTKEWLQGVNLTLISFASVGPPNYYYRTSRCILVQGVRCVLRQLSMATTNIISLMNDVPLWTSNETLDLQFCVITNHYHPLLLSYIFIVLISVYPTKMVPRCKIKIPTYKYR